MFPQSKNVTIAWPIKKGDGCLLVFSEQALDYWMYGKETDTKLKFDLTNAIAIPNLTSGGNSTMKLACDEDAVAIAAGDTKAKITPKTAELTLGSAKVEVEPSLVQITVGGTVLAISPDGVDITGKLTVKGGITARNDVKASNGSISLANHVHRGDSGGMTGKPQ